MPRRARCIVVIQQMHTSEEGLRLLSVSSSMGSPGAGQRELSATRHPPPSSPPHTPIFKGLQWFEQKKPSSPMKLGEYMDVAFNSTNKICKRYVLQLRLFVFKYSHCKGRGLGLMPIIPAVGHIRNTGGHWFAAITSSDHLRAAQFQSPASKWPLGTE
ncbi:hypothetical protein AAY473_029596 [Plecturocebus cupreus]